MENHNLTDRFLLHDLLETSIEKGTVYHFKFADFVLKYQKFDCDFIRTLIVKCLVQGGYHALSFAYKLIRTYNLQAEFPIINITDIAPDMVLTGFVHRIFENGAMVVIKVMREHVKAYESEAVKAKDLAIGQEVQVKIIEVDLKRRLVQGILECCV